MDPNRNQGAQQATSLIGPLQTNFWLLVNKSIDLYGFSEDIDIGTFRSLVELYTDPESNSWNWDPAISSLIATCSAAIVFMNQLSRADARAARPEPLNFLIERVEGLHLIVTTSLMGTVSTLQQSLRDIDQAIGGLNGQLIRIAQQLDHLIGRGERDAGIDVLAHQIYLGLNANTAAIDRLSLKIEGLTTVVERIDAAVGQFPRLEYGDWDSPVTICGSMTELHRVVAALPRQTTDLVCSEVVGDSYYRWDSTVRYYPTLVLIFTDPLSEAPVRRSQTKLRLTGYNSSPSLGEIQDLQARCERLLSGGLSYLTGQVRCNYVSPHNSKWKTTVFAASLSDAEHVLSVGCSLVGEVFVRERLSYTQGRHPRTDLDAGHPGINDRLMQLKKVALLINGSPSGPTVLYRRNE